MKKLAEYFLNGYLEKHVGFYELAGTNWTRLTHITPITNRVRHFHLKLTAVAINTEEEALSTLREVCAAGSINA